jgi:hypothetical protein
MAWHPYDLDHLAQEIVLRARQRDPNPKKTSLNQAYKMRATCAYGLERFWGEHLRLAGNRATEEDLCKAQFIADVWVGFVGIMAKAGVQLPPTMLSNQNSEAEIQAVAEQLWRIKPEDQQVPLAVLIALCDSVVWWTQRLKPGRGGVD